jgi:hypothetical protein
MIDDYVNKLIENLPDSAKTKEKIDLVLDGGIFNGSYLVGALYFLKEMERRKYVEVDRISGCSIGSVVAFLYLIDAFDLMPVLYKTVNSEFKTNYTLNTIKQLKTYLKDRIPEDICKKVNNKLFISYHDVKQKKKIVKSTYIDTDDIIDTIISSCYIPFLIDRNILYKNKYIDGLNAYIFPHEKGKRVLYMELYGYDKISNTLNVKNEKSNFHRVLHGLLDIHNFYIKQTNTSMCSYVDNWNAVNKFKFSIKLWIEYILLQIVYFTYYVKQYLSKDIKKHICVKIISRISFDIFSIMLEHYCL